MQSLFLVARLVIFAVLVNLNILIVAFASWNVGAAMNYGASTSNSAIFFLVNSCSLFVCVALGLAEYILPRARTSRVLYECLWSAILALFQTGASIGMTINTPEICRLTSDRGLCASSTLLVPTAWLSSIIMLTYFFALFITTMLHARVQRGIWFMTVHSVGWFGRGEIYDKNEKDDKDCAFSTDSWTRYLAKMESSRSEISLDHDVEKAPWARTIRRGVDAPFKKQEIPSVTQTSPPDSLRTPLKVQPIRTIAGSRFVEKFRESRTVSRSDRQPQHLESQTEPFPRTVEDYDLPIHLPRLSEWIRADAIKGITVHTIPYSP